MLLLAVALTAVACSSDEAPAGRQPTLEPVVAPPEVDDEPTPSASPFADRSTDELFDPATLHTFEFTVARATCSSSTATRRQRSTSRR